MANWEALRAMRLNRGHPLTCQCGQPENMHYPATMGGHCPANDCKAFRPARMVPLSDDEAGALAAAIDFVLDFTGASGDPESPATHLRSALAKIKQAAP